MIQFLKNTLISLWLVLAIFTTITLLSFNEYRVTEFGNYSLFNIDSDMLEPTFHEGDLVITKRVSPQKVEIGEDIFFYRSSSSAAVINVDTVVNKEEITDLQNGQTLSSEYAFGKVDQSKVIPYAGFVMSILQSKWGFMFAVIFPTILLFVYEIYSIIWEVKEEDKEN